LAQDLNYFCQGPRWHREFAKHECNTSPHLGDSTHHGAHRRGPTRAWAPALLRTPPLAMTRV